MSELATKLDVANMGFVGSSSLEYVVRSDFGTVFSPDIPLAGYNNNEFVALRDIQLPGFTFRTYGSITHIALATGDFGNVYRMPIAATFNINSGGVTKYFPMDAYDGHPSITKKLNIRDTADIYGFQNTPSGGEWR